jgi:hypothetical protein
MLLRRWVLVIFTLLAALLAACSSDDGGGAGASGGTQEAANPAERIARSADATREQGSARVSVDQTINRDGQEVMTTSEGVVDMDENAAQLTTSSEGAETEVVVDGTTTYLRVPPEQGAVLGEGVEWVKFDLGAIGEQAGIDLAALQSQQGSDQTLIYLTGATDVREEGTEEVGGTDTTHYSFTIDFAKLAEQGPEATRSSFQSLIDNFDLDTAPAEVWIDGDELIRRFSFEATYDFPEGSPVDKFTSSSTVEYSDFGVEANIEVPSGDSVVDFQEAVGQQGG